MENMEGRKKARCIKTTVGESRRIGKDELKTVKMNSITQI